MEYYNCEHCWLMLEWVDGKPATVSPVPPGDFLSLQIPRGGPPFREFRPFNKRIPVHGLQVQRAPVCSFREL